MVENKFVRQRSVDSVVMASNPRANFRSHPCDRFPTLYCHVPYSQQAAFIVLNVFPSKEQEMKDTVMKRSFAVIGWCRIILCVRTREG